MKKSAFTTLCLAIIFTSAIAQPGLIRDYDWDDRVDYVFESDKDREILYVNDITAYDFEKDDLKQYKLWHLAHLLNSDEAVDDHNKLFISVDESEELVEIMIRVISPDGSIAEEKDPELLSSVDEDSGEYYTYFAIKGIETGDIVEYMYVIKSNPVYQGTIRRMQREVPVREYHFSLLSPENLIFDFKTYNTDSVVVPDEDYEEMNLWKLDLYDLPGIPEEEYAPVYLLSASVVYKLDQNRYNNTRDISSYGNVARNLYTNLHELEKKEGKALKKFIRQLDIDDLSVENKIKTIERVVKTDIRMDNAGGTSNIDEIMDGAAANDFGLMRIFVNVFDQVGIENEVVITSNRRFSKFDPEFEAFNFLSEYLMYFPGTDAFMAPTWFEFRYGLVPEQYTNNYGLFITERKLGDFTTGIGKIKYIPSAPYSASASNHYAEVEFSEDMEEAKVDLTLELTGYYAANLQPYFPYYDEERKEEIVKNILEGNMETMEIGEWTLEGIEEEDIGEEPFRVKCKGTDNSLIRKAGEQYLFKLGLLIGPQMEMYSETARQNPLYSDYKREFRRELKVHIPEGYSMKNPDDLIFNETYINEGDTTLYFVSSYKIEDDLLTVRLDEYYDQLYFPVEEYEEYRRVVNSAADFNKVVLVFEKE